MTDENLNQNTNEDDDQESSDSVGQLKEKIEDLNNKLLLARADLENMQKRMQKERENALKYSIFKFAQEILSIADGLERALYSIQNSADHKRIIEGIELVQKELSSLFSKNGIKKLESLKKNFDPNYHEAIFEVKEGEQEENTVVQVVQEGYLMHDRLLRPALVGIKKSPKD